MATWDIDATREDTWMIIDPDREPGFREVCEIAFNGADAEQLADHIVEAGKTYPGWQDVCLAAF